MPHVASVCHLLPCLLLVQSLHTSLQERQLLAEGVKGWQQNYFMPGTSDTGTDRGKGRGSRWRVLFFWEVISK